MSWALEKLEESSVTARRKFIFTIPLYSLILYCINTGIGKKILVESSIKKKLCCDPRNAM
jgi:hypothetical protein